MSQTTTAPYEPIAVRYPDDELPAEGFRDSGIQWRTGTLAGVPNPSIPQSLNPFASNPYSTGFHALVAAELASARALWPPMTDLGESAEVIREELAEFQVEVFKKAQHRDRGKLLKELVQIAAMCQRAAEDLGLAHYGCPATYAPRSAPLPATPFNFADLVAARYPRMWKNIPDQAFTSHGALARLRVCCKGYTDIVEANLYRPQEAWPYSLLLDELVALATLCWCCSSALRLTLNPPIPESPNPCSPTLSSQEST